MNKNSPAVSVIVPVFNAEKYLPACLESILAQTLADIEVIVVDDCSTDQSLRVAKNFRVRDGRLKVVSLPTNTGSGAVPRNVGLENSRGEYVFFMDADDMIVDSALAELFYAAQSFRANVVCMDRGFICESDLSDTQFASWDKNSAPVADSTLESENLAERISKLFNTHYGWAPWTKFVQRSFLVAGGIKFPKLKISEDVVWTIKLVLKAKRWLCFPRRLYVYRRSNNSMMRSTRSPVDELKFWLDPLVKGLEYLDDFMDATEFFAQNPNYRFEVTNFFVKMQVAGMLGALESLSREELYEIVRREFRGSRHAALIANLFVFMAYYRDKNRG